MLQPRPSEDRTDEDLVVRSRRGDREAFAALVDRHRDGILRFVRRMTPGPDAEDLAQEVFVRAFRALGRYRGDGSFRNWLYRIARNRCLSEIRRRKGRGVHVSWDEEGDEKVHLQIREKGPGPAAEIESRDLGRRVRRLVARLPESPRTALTLFYLNGFRYEEIAEIMEMPLGTVKTHIRRGRLRLRQLVVAELGGREELIGGGEEEGS